jgi:hypothetical protein
MMIDAFSSDLVICSENQRSTAIVSKVLALRIFLDHLLSLNSILHFLFKVLLMAFDDHRKLVESIMATIVITSSSLPWLHVFLAF